MGPIAAELHENESILCVKGTETGLDFHDYFVNDLLHACIEWRPESIQGPTLNGNVRYQRFLINGENIDCDSIRLSEKGFENVKNPFVKPVYVVNGVTWNASQQPLLPMESISKNLSKLNFAGATFTFSSLTNDGSATYKLAEDSVELDFIHIPGGAANYVLSIDIPYLDDVPFEVTRNGLTWIDPWQVKVFGFGPAANGLPPDFAKVTSKQPLSESTFETIDWTWWDKAPLE